MWRQQPLASNCRLMICDWKCIWLNIVAQRYLFVRCWLQKQCKQLDTSECTFASWCTRLCGYIFIFCVLLLLMPFVFIANFTVQIAISGNSSAFALCVRHESGGDSCLPLPPPTAARLTSWPVDWVTEWPTGQTVAVAVAGEVRLSATLVVCCLFNESKYTLAATSRGRSRSRRRSRGLWAAKVAHSHSELPAALNGFICWDHARGGKGESATWQPNTWQLCNKIAKLLRRALDTAHMVWRPLTSAPAPAPSPSQSSSIATWFISKNSHANRIYMALQDQPTRS